MTDTEMLDWMESNLQSLSRAQAPLMGGQVWFGQILHTRRIGSFRIAHRTIRAAIEEAANPKEIDGSISKS